MNRVAVIGGAGFIGQHVVERLVAGGNDVLAVGRRPAVSNILGAQYISADIANGADNIVAGVDVVVHLASATTPAAASQDPAYDVKANLLPCLALLDSCVRLGVRRVVYGSSGGTVYGPTDAPASESHPRNPFSPYGIVKLAVEQYLVHYAAKYGLEYVILRCANAFGPGQQIGRSQGVVAELLFSLAQKREFTVWGDGLSVRDYVYVTDLARAFVLAADTVCANTAYNIGTGIGTSLLDLIRDASDITGRVPRLNHCPAAPDAVVSSKLDVGQAERMLGWRPTVSLRKGLELTWQWVLAALGRETATVR